MVMQVRRTLTVGATPTGLAEGQISVGMADRPPTAWVGVPASVNPAGVIPITGLVRTVAGAPQPAGALGQLWWDEDAAQLFVYTGSEWVVAVNPPIPDLSLFATQAQLSTGLASIPTYANVAVYGLASVIVNGVTDNSWLGSFPPPASGIAQYEVWGGGGGSGGVTGPGGVSGPGGGGGYVMGVATGLTTPTTVTVGAGGTAGGYGPITPGGAGGASSFGAFATANGGGAGLHMTGLAAGTVGAGGTTTGGMIGINGEAGLAGYALAAGAWFSGMGGAAWPGSWNRYYVQTTGLLGQAGRLPGQGASPSLIDAGGVAGAPGRVIVRW